MSFAGAARRTAALTLATTALAVLGALTAPAAQAHNVVVGTDPLSGASLTVAPSQVVVHLEEPPVAVGNAITVTAPGGESVTSGATSVDGSDVVVGLAPLTTPGVYTVAYRTVSDDGHTITGTYTFTLATTASPTPTQTPAPSRSASASASAAATAGAAEPASSSTSDSSGPAAWLIGAAVVGVGVVAVVASRRRTP